MKGNGIQEELVECLKLGILHIPSGNFLTAEIFNNEINISGTAMRRKQVWTLVMQSKQANTNVVYLQNHLGRFMSANKDGKISAVSRDPDMDERFRLEFSPHGEWAFKSDVHGFYLTGSSDCKVSCFSKTPYWWSIRLAIHPQVHIRHQFRSRYLRLINDDSELRADQPYPWGPESVIWLEQPSMMTITTGYAKSSTNANRSRFGRVAFRTTSGKYLSFDGHLNDEMDDSALYGMEFRPGNPSTFAFRAPDGGYLTTVGPGTTKTKSSTTTVGKEELFIIERTSLQVGLLAHNGKFASVKQGVEVSANQYQIDEASIFQLEFMGMKGFNVLELVTSSPNINGSFCLPDAVECNGFSASTNSIPLSFSADYFLNTGYWRLRSRSGKLWKLAASSGVKNVAADDDLDSRFELITLNKANTEYGHRCLVFCTKSGEQSLTARKLGAVSTSGRTVNENDECTNEELFRFVLVNRPSIVFLSALTQAFLTRGKHNCLDANGLVCEPFDLRITTTHNYAFFSRNSNSSYSLMSACADGQIQLESTDRTPDDELDLESKFEFQLHFLGHGRVLVQALGYRDRAALLKAELKANCKLDELHGDGVTINHIWEI